MRKTRRATLGNFGERHQRARAFGQLTLARVLVHAGRPDEAAALGTAVCSVAPSLTSARVRARLAWLGDAIRPLGTAAGVTDFLGQLAALVAADGAGRGAPTWPV